MKPVLELTAPRIELLIRSALLDDATNTGERLAVLLAEIAPDDDGDFWVTLDNDLWPEDKDPARALAVARLLGIELELNGTDMTLPFLWPGMAVECENTEDYVAFLLNAYAGKYHGEIVQDNDADNDGQD